MDRSRRDRANAEFQRLAIALGGVSTGENANGRTWTKANSRERSLNGTKKSFNGLVRELKKSRFISSDKASDLTAVHRWTRPVPGKSDSQSHSDFELALSLVRRCLQWSSPAAPRDAALIAPIVLLAPHSASVSDSTGSNYDAVSAAATKWPIPELRVAIDRRLSVRASQTDPA